MNRQVALIGETRTGKSTFLMSNARGNVWAVDAEHGLERYKDLTESELFYPSKRGCVDPIHIFLEAEKSVWDKKIETIAIDSVTKIYGRQSRVASMAGQLTKQQREKLGFGKSKAKDMVGKANAIQVLTNLIVYGTDVFYVWHSGEYLDVASTTYDMIQRDAISTVERKRLMTSVDIVLRFSLEKGSYRVFVDPETRNIGRQPARTGFYLTDPPRNFWAGTMDKLENLIYLSFSSPEEAIEWGAEALGKAVEDMTDFYTHVRDEAKPKTASLMWFAWISAIYSEGNGNINPGNNGQGPDKKETEPTKPIQPTQPPAKQPEPDYVPEPEPVTDLEFVYGNNDEVPEDDMRDFLVYVTKFGRAPYEPSQLRASKGMHKDLDKDWYSVLEEEEE